MFNNRNYYWILQVQPDAPAEVIKQNYRLLLNKLRMHPDLGGNEKDAILINIACRTLSNPEKRAEYDRLLLKQKNIGIPAHLQSHVLFPRQEQAAPERTWKQNRRNYYRILQVQPNAHPVIIKARYLALLGNSDQPRDLLHEAFIVLDNAQKRAEYDRLLRYYNHVAVVEKMKIGRDESSLDFQFPTPIDAWARNTFHDSPDPYVSAPQKNNICRPFISRCCPFCNTVYSRTPVNGYEKSCPACHSPSVCVGEEFFGKSSRLLERKKRSAPINFYTMWPGPKLPGRLVDISPAGLRFNSDTGLESGQIIKIDAPEFKAVAEVVHCRKEDNMTSSGVRFRTATFDSAKGNFLSTSA